MSIRIVMNFGIRVGILLVLVWAGVSSARAGLSRMLSQYSSDTDSIEASKRALDFNPRDAEAHHVHGMRLADDGQTAEGVAALERAISLRPEDYFLWQELGRLREENNDAAGAIEALQTATRLAPFYAQPHWQLGNILLRETRGEAAFREMRIAATSDPELFGAMLDLAFSFYEGASETIVSVVAPVNDRERALVVKLFLSHQQNEVALAMVQQLGTISSKDRHDLVNALLFAEEFQAAFRIWLAGRDEQTTLFDGGFEESINTNEAGFGWQPTKLTQTVKVLIDPAQPKAGRRSLRIDYSGNFDEVTPVISQLIPVEPNSRYRLSFTARTENLMSAGLPIVTVRESNGVTVVESDSISQGTNPWSAQSIVFDSKESKAMTINLQRTLCNVKPCPITGRAWFDEFVLTKLDVR